MGRYPGGTTSLVVRSLGALSRRVRRLIPMALPLDKLGTTYGATAAVAEPARARAHASHLAEIV